VLISPCYLSNQLTPHHKGMHTTTEKTTQTASSKAAVTEAMEDINHMMSDITAEETDAEQYLLRQQEGLREKLRRCLFELKTPIGRITNYSILGLIMVSVLIAMMDTLPDFHQQWGKFVNLFQSFVLYAFLLEYCLRVYAARERKAYILSFNGMIDLLTVLPLMFGGQSAVAVRLL